VLTVPIETKPFDEADYLTSEKLIEGYLDEAIATGDTDVIRLALNVVARARKRLRRRSKKDD
jgi:DNA-binding phage protein